MRVVEFRAWDIDKQEYITWFEIGCEGCVTTQEPNCSPDYPNAILEQYTGLKDKNGKKIYEGDIVRINGWWDAEGPAGYDKNLCVVEWDEEKTGFEPFNNYDCDCGVYHHAEDCEVIGNIHESPELVKEKE